MEELKEGICQTGSKECCKKSVIMIIVCALFFFLLGYYFGNKSNSNISRTAGSRINRPFSPNLPRMPKNIPNNTQKSHNVKNLQSPAMPKTNVVKPKIRPNNIKPVTKDVANIQGKIQSPQIQEKPKTTNKAIAKNKVIAKKPTKK